LWDYHSISSGQWPNTTKLCTGFLRRVMSAVSDDLASTITQPKLNWDGLGWVGTQSKGKQANKCSAHVNSFKTVIKSKGGYSEEHKKYILIYLTLFGYYMIPYVLFNSFDVFTIILQYRSKNKENLEWVGVSKHLTGTVKEG
jgi:hypothetical protein